MRWTALLLLALLLAPLAFAQDPAPRVARLPEALVGASAAVVGDRIYVMAGRNASGSSSSVYRFDGTTVEMFAPLPMVPGSLDGGRESTTGFGIGDKAYLVGGAARTQAIFPRALADIVELDTVTNTTRVTTDTLPTGRFGATAAVIGTSAYIFGGFSADPSVYYNDVVMYNASAPEGARVRVHPSAFPVGIRDARAIALPDAILIVGGQMRTGTGPWACPSTGGGQPASLCSSDIVARFDPATGATTILARLPSPMTHVEAGVLFDRELHVIGGLGSAMTTTYAPAIVRLDTGVVTRGPAIENATGSGAVALLNGTLYRFGGRLASGAEPRTDVRAYHGGVPPPGLALALSARPVAGGTLVSWTTPLGSTAAPEMMLERLGETPAQLYVGDRSTFLHATSPGDILHYRLRVVNATPGRSVELHSIAGVAPLAAPVAEALLLQRSVRITWQAVPNATGYAIERDGQRLASFPPDVRVFQEDEPGAVYVVRALAPGVDGLPSALLFPKTVAAPSDVTTELVPNDERVSWALVVSWNGSAPDHEVLLGDRASALRPVVRTNASSYRIARLAPGTPTWVAVRGVYGDLSGPESVATRIDAPPRPAPPAWLFANASATAISLTWEALAGPFTLWRDGVPLAEGIGAATYLDTTARPGVFYSYTVTTEGALRSEPSPEASAFLVAPGDEPRAAPTPRPATLTPSPPSPSSPRPLTPTPIATPSPSPSEKIPVTLEPAPGDAPTPAPGAVLLLLLVFLVAVGRRSP